MTRGISNNLLHVSDSPILLSFPHFYLGDDKVRTAVEGISPPDPSKHEFYIDVQPVSDDLLQPICYLTCIGY